MIIEKTIRDFLSSRLNVPVYCERPEKKPEAFVIVSKAGSSRTDRLNRANISILANAGTLYDAMTLDQQIKDIMDADDIPDVNCVFEGDYNYTDTASKTYRYQCIYNTYYY